MMQREALSDRLPERDQGIDLDTLAAQVADSGVLRRTVRAVLTTPLPEPAP